MADYDMSIHSNPDARAWAKFFCRTFIVQHRDGYLTRPVDDDVELMTTWFANAMMAMHDHMRPDLAPVVLPDGSAFVVM